MYLPFVHCTTKKLWRSEEAFQHYWTKLWGFILPIVVLLWSILVYDCICIGLLCCRVFHSSVCFSKHFRTFQKCIEMSKLVCCRNQTAGGYNYWIAFDMIKRFLKHKRKKILQYIIVLDYCHNFADFDTGSPTVDTVCVARIRGTH